MTYDDGRGRRSDGEPAPRTEPDSGVEGVSRLPREIDPGVDLRPAIRAEIRRRSAARRRMRTVLPLAAAMVLALAGVLGLALARGGGEPVAPTVTGGAGPAETVLALDREYDRAAAELRRALASAGALPPTAERLVAGSLGTVERALAESRRALREDPSSPVLRELVLATHRQRLDVLRQAAALAAEPREAT